MPVWDKCRTISTQSWPRGFSPSSPPARWFHWRRFCDLVNCSFLTTDAVVTGRVVVVVDGNVRVALDIYLKKKHEMWSNNLNTY